MAARCGFSSAQRGVVLIWVLCLGGTVYLFNIIPKAFCRSETAPFIQACSSLKRVRRRANARVPSASRGICRPSAVDETVTLSGSSGLFQANQGVVLAILKDPSARPPIQAVAGQQWAR